MKVREKWLLDLSGLNILGVQGGQNPIKTKIYSQNLDWNHLSPVVLHALQDVKRLRILYGKYYVLQIQLCGSFPLSADDQDFEFLFWKLFTIYLEIYYFNFPL